jgi:hypothetical protein
MLTKPAAFDPDTVSLLGAVLEQAIAKLPPDGRSQERKTLLASKLLSAASAGERDPVRLQAAALAVGPYFLLDFTAVIAATVWPCSKSARQWLEGIPQRPAAADTRPCGPYPSNEDEPLSATDSPLGSLVALRRAHAD